jgi:hypothetical protein
MLTKSETAVFEPFFQLGLRRLRVVEAGSDAEAESQSNQRYECQASHSS